MRHTSSLPGALFQRLAAATGAGGGFGVPWDEFEVRARRVLRVWSSRACPTSVVRTAGVTKPFYIYVSICSLMCSFHGPPSKWTSFSTRAAAVTTK